MHSSPSLLTPGSLLARLKMPPGYLDSVSEGLVVQILIVVMVSIAATIRLWQSRLQSLIGGGRDVKVLSGADHDNEYRDINQV